LLVTQAGNVTVSPAASVWTEFEVRDLDGRVQIDARKGDLKISDEAGTTMLAQGQQTTRDDSTQAQETREQKDRKKRGGAAVPAAGGGGVLNAKVAIGVGVAAIAGVTAWVLVQGDEPVSPAK
jgi:hypothetical protein